MTKGKRIAASTMALVFALLAAVVWLWALGQTINIMTLGGLALAVGVLVDEATVARPDLKAAAQAVDKAQTDHRLAIANGSTDPTFGMDIARNPPITAYFGFSVNIPLRIFDRNQGEKARTEIDIRRAERVTVQARGLDGQLIVFECTGLLARAAQHEVDHLNGILFIDRVDPKKRQRLLAAYEEKVGA